MTVKKEPPRELLRGCSDRGVQALTEMSTSRILGLKGMVCARLGIDTAESCGMHVPECRPVPAIRWATG